MHKPVFIIKPLLLAMASAWVAFSSASHASISNDITVTTAEPSTILNIPYDSVTITPNGSFTTSSGSALTTTDTVIGTLVNNGTIESTAGSANDSGLFVSNGSTINNLTNNGLISGNWSHINYAIYNGGNIGTLENMADGVIKSNIGLNNFGTITSLINHGLIQAPNTGITNSRTITDFTNNGKIEAVYAIENLGTLTNGITNNGTITGRASAISNYGVLPVINNNGTLAGDIRNNTSSAMTINGGNSYASTLTGYSGAGIIYSENADLIFGTGKLTLDDDIQVTESTAVNEGASLLINRYVTIQGNYIQQQAGQLAIGVADGAVANGSTLDSGYGRLIVIGDAIFAPNSGVSLLTTGQNYRFAVGQRYLVVQASGTGTQFNDAQLKYTAAGYSGSVTGKTVELEDGKGLAVYLGPGEPDMVTHPSKPSTPSTPNPAFATTPNAISSLRGLGNYSGFSGGLLNLYNASLAIGSKEEANKAGEQLSPVQNSAASSTASAASSSALTVVNNHMNTTRLARNGSAQSGIATGDDALEWAVWGQPFYGSARQGMVDNVSGYTAHYGGVVFGADRQVAENWRLGGAFSYARSSVNGADNLVGSHTDVDAWSGIAYASWTGNPLYVNLTASVSTQQYDSQRRIGFDGFSGKADGSFNGQQVMTKAEVGYPIFFGEGTTLTPLAAMSYSYQHQEGYKEHSDDGAALKVDANHNQSVRSSLGGKLEHSWSTGMGDVVPFVQAMWTHEYDRSRTSTSASYVADALGETRFTSLGASPAADTADLSAGVALVQSDSLSVSARYDLSTAPHFDAQTVSLRLRKLF